MRPKINVRDIERKSHRYYTKQTQTEPTNLQTITKRQFVTTDNSDRIRYATVTGKKKKKKICMHIKRKSRKNRPP